MFTLTPRKFIRLISLIVMVALMFTFIHTMAQSYFTSMKCITDMSVSCEDFSGDDTQMVDRPSDNDPATDEWLCANNEVAYCAPSQPGPVTIVQLRDN